MRIYLIAGEASGDLHAANLVRALRERDPALEVRALGGDQLQAAGASLVRHNRDLNHFGIVEVIKHLPQIFGLFKVLRQDIAAYQPDAVVLVDYPGFNLRLAAQLKRAAATRAIKIFYYIVPQVWAWKEDRLKTLRRATDRLFTILPFEKPWFQSRGMDVDFVGHPLLDAFAAWQHQPDTLRQDIALDDRPILALLPGSRMNEIRGMLPTMLAAAQAHASRVNIVLAVAPNLDPAFFDEMIDHAGLTVHCVQGRTYDVLRSARAALVTSGTATLETALWGVPQVLCYRVSPISYLIARQLIKLSYVGLPNLILNRPVIRELLQDELTTAAVARELDHLLWDEGYRGQMKADYHALRVALGEQGASGRAADRMLALLGG